MYKFQPVLELLRNKSVTDFQNAFGDSYGTDKGISFESFFSLLKSDLELNVTESDAKHLFCQIDHYLKGTVSSMELNNYLENYEKKRTESSDGPFEVEPTLYPGVRCQDSIIDWILYPEEPDVQDEVAGHYVCLSRSGLLSIWTKDMRRRFETTIETIDDGETRKLTTWATSISCLPKEKLLAVSTTAGDIRFFRSSIYKFEHKISITCLPSIVLQIQCYDSHRLVCGDFSGNVFIIFMEEKFFTRNRRRASHLAPERILFDHLKSGKFSGLAFEGTAKLHYSPVQKVEYIPSLGAVISCSVCTKRAMLVHFLENNESLSFRSAGGILSFAFCKRFNFIITGGVDHAVKIWNPTVNTSYNEALTGHSSPVNHILVDEDRLFLISADREKIVRVWDLLHPKCLQIIKFKESQFPGRHSFASIYLDVTDGRLILATYLVGKLEFQRMEFRDKTHPNSELIILAAYSRIFHSLVTVGNTASVAVWDAETGSLIYEFDKTHDVVDSDKVAHNMGIMAAGLDPSGRRLITGDRVGTIKVWNFYLGLCLQSFKANFIIMSLTFVGFHIYAAGSSEEIMDFYDNGAETVEAETWEKRHTRSIVSLDFYKRFLIASASWDGEIVIWLRKSTDAKLQMKDLKDEDLKDIKIDENFSGKLEIEKRRRCSISQILFLQTREMDFFVGNLVSCGMDGWMRFWNVVCTHKVNECKLLSKFRGTFRNCDGVLCMTTDANNHYLITGDTMGYVRVYQLDNYYQIYGSSPSKTHKPTRQQMALFPFLKLQQLLDGKHSQCSKFPKESGSELGYAPHILNCFRAHLRPLLQVAYSNDKNLLITAGRESSVRLWTIAGLYIGRLGPVGENWGLNVAEERVGHKPPDVKAAASSVTLYVLNGGNTPYWNRALESLRRCRMGHQPEGFTEKPLKWKLKKALPAEELSKSGRSLEDELAARLPQFRGKACKKKVFQDVENEL